MCRTGIEVATRQGGAPAAAHPLGMVAQQAVVPILPVGVRLLRFAGSVLQMTDLGHAVRPSLPCRAAMGLSGRCSNWGHGAAAA